MAGGAGWLIYVVYGQASNPSGSSIAYAVSKSAGSSPPKSPHDMVSGRAPDGYAGLHLMRCLATSQGPKVRVNAVNPLQPLPPHHMGVRSSKI